MSMEYFDAFTREVYRLITEAGGDPVELFARNSPALTTGRDVNANAHKQAGTSPEAGALAWFAECIKPLLEPSPAKPTSAHQLPPHVIRYCGRLAIHMRYTGVEPREQRQRFMGYVLTEDGRRWNFRDIMAGASSGKSGPTAEDFDKIAQSVVAFGSSEETNGDKELASDIGDESDYDDKGPHIRRTKEYV